MYLETVHYLTLYSPNTDMPCHDVNHKHISVPEHRALRDQCTAGKLKWWHLFAVSLLSVPSGWIQNLPSQDQKHWCFGNSTATTSSLMALDPSFSISLRVWSSSSSFSEAFLIDGIHYTFFEYRLPNSACMFCDIYQVRHSAVGSRVWVIAEHICVVCVCVCSVVCCLCTGNPSFLSTSQCGWMAGIFFPRAHIISACLLCFRRFR